MEEDERRNRRGPEERGWCCGGEGEGDQDGGEGQDVVVEMKSFKEESAVLMEEGSDEGFFCICIRMSICICICISLFVCVSCFLTLNPNNNIKMSHLLILKVI